MSLIILVSFSLLALVVTSRPVLPVQKNLTGDRPVALRNAIQAVFDNLSNDVPDPLLRDDHEPHARSTSAEEQNEYLIELDDASVMAVDYLSENEVPPTEDKKSYEFLGNSQLDDLSGDVKASSDSVVSGVSVEPEGEHLPSDKSPAESDRSDVNSMPTQFILSPPLLMFTFSCIMALLGVLCVAVALYITRYLRSKIRASMEMLELLPRFGKDNGELGPGDSRGSDSLPNVDGNTTGLPKDTLAGGTVTPLGLEKPEESVLEVEKLVDLPDLDANQSHEKLVDDVLEPAVDPFDDPVLPLQYPVLTCEYPVEPSEDKVLPMVFEDNPWESARKDEDDSHDEELEEDDEEDSSETFHDVEDVKPGILITTVDNVSSRSHKDGLAIDASPGQLYADPDLMPLPPSPSVPSSVSGSPVSGSPVSAPPSPTRMPIRICEALQSSPISRPSWSLRAADAPALGVPSNTSSKPSSSLPSPFALSVALPSLSSIASPNSAPPSSVSLSSPTSISSPHTEPVGSSTATTEIVPARRRAFRYQVPEFDIALAMQLRPGLGLGADPAWMVRFLMAMFGWIAVLLTGKRTTATTAVKTITATKE